MYTDDITYCSRKECKNAACFRHSRNIDWSTPKHRVFCASIADFGMSCSDYDPDLEGNDDCETDGSRV